MDADSTKVVVDYSPLLLRSIWSMFGFATLFAWLRAFAKLTTGVPFWWDDHFLNASWLCLLVSTALLARSVDFGTGLHFEDMVLENIPIVAEYSFAAGFATILGQAWSKTSFGLTILRISDGWMRWLVLFIIISMNLVLTTNAILLYAQCTPIRRLFDELAEVYSGVGDIVLAMLPWKIVWKAKLFKREKIGVLVAMSLGVFSGIMSFLKIISLGEISDVRSTTVDLKIFGIAELAVTIIAVSIPILRVFIRQGHRSYVSKSSTGQRSNQVSAGYQSPTAFSGNHESQRGGIPMKQTTVAEPIGVYRPPESWARYEV
ncbi:uncharacterized protein DNG_07401 [Cephalotrichum gorgonifer]|uniref:Rhodopsin domain-containing protein n=1 Tax=Cephalotrichum gorgonifer TaxID=2041049 RepID=A0AAE8N1H4_9PEZI|nr:uncharacterized protein DNG_07401 [Cephalotrichum gorgonifer]